MSRANKAELRAAVERAQNNDSGNIDSATEHTLQQGLEQIWQQIQNQPSSYIMDMTEFAVFNRYRSDARFQNETARKAIERYWNSKSEANSH